MQNSTAGERRRPPGRRTPPCQGEGPRVRIPSSAPGQSAVRTNGSGERGAPAARRHRTATPPDRPTPTDRHRPTDTDRPTPTDRGGPPAAQRRRDRAAPHPCSERWRGRAEAERRGCWAVWVKEARGLAGEAPPNGTLRAPLGPQWDTYPSANRGLWRSDSRGR